MLLIITTERKSIQFSLQAVVDCDRYTMSLGIEVLADDWNGILLY